MISNHALLSTDRKSVALSSLTLILYGFSQLILCFIAIEGLSLSVILYTFGSIYLSTGAIGLLASRGNGFGLLRAFKTLSVILMILNTFLILFCIVCFILILTTYKSKCKKNSSFCEEQRPEGIFGIILIFAIPTIVSLGTIVYLKLVFKFAKTLEKDMQDLFNSTGFIPH